jgi:hypothetical protein
MLTITVLLVLAAAAALLAHIWTGSRPPLWVVVLMLVLLHLLSVIPVR